MARHRQGSYVMWRTPILTPRWFDDSTTGLVAMSFAYARSWGLVQVRLHCPLCRRRFTADDQFDEHLAELHRDAT